MIGIYKITSPMGKIYIGQSVNVEKRFLKYKAINTSKNQIALYRSFLKYGIENHTFEVIEECEVAELNNRERYWQDFYHVINSNGLNCKLTKGNSKSGFLSDETKKKISKSHETRTPSKKQLQVLRTNWIGRKHSEESIEKMRKNNARANLGRKASLETRLKLSKNHSRHSSKMVLNVLTGIYYDSIMEASLTTNFKYEYIKTNLNGTTSKNRTNFILI